MPSPEPGGSPPTGPRPPVTVAPDGDSVLVAVAGALDDVVGHQLLAAVAAVVANGVARLDLDLRGVTGFTRDGVAALRSCRRTGAELHGGVHFHTGAGEGRAALLAAYTGTDPVDDGEN